MFLFRYLTLAILCTLTVGINQTAFAAGSGAFRLEVPDSAASGKGSAFVGEANNPSAVYYNPAGLTQIKSMQVSMGGALIAPQSDFKKASDGDVTQMRRNTFFVPHMYAAVPINEKLTFGLGATSYFGLGTEWATDSNLKTVSTSSDLENKDYMFTMAYQMTDQLSVAVSADNDDTKASKNKKLTQGGVGDDANFQLKAKDSAWGYRLATMYKVNDKHQFGLMYRSSIHHKYEGKAYLDGLNSAGFGYQAVFGGTSYETRVTEKFTLPQSVVLGYSFKPTNKWTFNFDLEWMDWSSVKQDALNWVDETGAGPLFFLNVGNPEPRDWKSVWSQSIGAEYAATDRLRLRGGYYHHASPVPQSTFHSNLPDANSHGFTTGFGYDLSKNLTLDMAYALVVYEPRKVDSDISSVIDGKYSQITNVLYGTATYKF